MLKLNIKGDVWLTSDTHFGHGNIIKYCNRPFLSKHDIEALEANGGKWHDGNWKGEFASDHRVSRDAIEKMNNHLIEKTNEYVGRNDTLIHLGDFCFARKDKYREMVRSYRSRINCQNIIMIWGNHDHPSGAHHSFQENHMMVNTKIFGQRITLCHYAMAVFDKSHRGAIHAYGHSHSTAERFMNEKFPNRRSMDVGVDNIAKLYGEYRPISFTELKDRMNKNQGHAIDHHVVGKDVPTEEDLLKS